MNARALSPRALSPLTLALGVFALGVLAPGRALADDRPGPAHPRDLKFPELPFDPPSPDSRRLQLENGLVAYVVADPLLPVVRIRAYVRTGAAWDPEKKEGLAGLVFSTLRSGGAGSLDPDELAEKLDSLSATIDGSCDDLRATLDAWTHARRLDQVLALFADVLRRPRFEKERFERARDDAASDAKTDEDDAKRVANRRLRRAIYGDHPIARSRTPDTLASISREEAVAFHRANVVPGRVVLAISGAFDEKAMRKKVEDLFGDWKGDGKGWAELPAVVARAKTGIRLVDRADMTQGHVELAHMGIKAADPDEPALTIADHILGAGSFTSRITARVRGDEGLAYSIDSSFEESPVIPGLTRITYQSRALETCYALKLVLDEARGLATDGPTKDELEGARNAVLGRYPGRFATASDTARALAEAELDGYPRDYFATYRARISALTSEQVRAAAKKYFDPDGMSVVVVGPEDKVRESPARGIALEALGKVWTEKAGGE